mgnify:CR=1 FL=1
MTPHTYAPGDKVKIISMEEVRRHPETGEGNYEIGESLWVQEMDHYAGTTQKIYKADPDYFWVDKKGFAFSPEMISGPAEAPQVPDREKYEHCTKAMGSNELDSELDAFSKEGWELVAVVGIGGGDYRLFFKRSTGRI